MLDIRNVKSVKEIPVLVLRLFSLMLVTTVCFLFQSNQALLAKDENYQKFLGLRGHHMVPVQSGLILVMLLYLNMHGKSA